MLYFEYVSEFIIRVSKISKNLLESILLIINTNTYTIVMHTTKIDTSLIWSINRPSISCVLEYLSVDDLKSLA